MDCSKSRTPASALEIVEALVSICMLFAEGRAGDKELYNDAIFLARG